MEYSFCGLFKKNILTKNPKKIRKFPSARENLKKIRKSPSTRSHVKKNASTANDKCCGTSSTSIDV